MLILGLGGDGLRESLESYCRRMKLEYLLDQWDAPRNLPLTPSQVSHGSKRKTWWKCEKGHSWQAAVYTRTGSRTGCPVCTGKVVQLGETDLAAQYPALARQWHPSRNGTLTPQQVLPGSHKVVWWACEKNHEWQAQVKSRVAGCSCPVCANRKIHSTQNDLAAQFPELAGQWHPTKNGPMTPDMVVPGSKRKVWWVCANGHEWLASVASRTSGGTGCPVCAGKKVVPGENDLDSMFPDLAAQWHPVKNGTLTPTQVARSSNRKVWWICEKGHDYLAAVAARTIHGSGCPYCAGRRVLPGFNDLEHLRPEVAGQWHPTLNGLLLPNMVTVGSHRKVWWQCDQGHVWKAVIASRAGPQRCGCPVCSGHSRLRRSRV